MANQVEDKVNPRLSPGKRNWIKEAEVEKSMQIKCLKKEPCHGIAILCLN